MKKKLNRVLSLLLALAMCLSFLPGGMLPVARAAGGGNPDPAETPAVTIQGTPQLIKGDYQYTASDRTPFLSVEWNYGDFSLPQGETWSATVSAWAGTSTTRPGSYWYGIIDATGSSGSFNGKLTKSQGDNPDQIYSNCMVQVDLNYNGTTYTATQQGVATVQSGSNYTAPVSVTISGTPALSGTSSYSLNVGWIYDKSITGDFSGMIYAWKDDGNNGSLPNSYWFQEYTGGDGGTSDSTTVTLRQQGSPDALEGDCWVQVSLGLSAQAKVESAPKKVNFGGGSSGGGGTNENPPTPSNRLPVIEQVTYYDSAYSGLPSSYNGNPAVWYLYTEGSNNLEVFALLPAASQAAAKSASMSGYDGFESSGQWYSVAGLWTVSPNTDLMDKGNGERALMTPLYCGSTPTQGTTLYLALFDYDNGNALSNLVPVTVPGTGGTANGVGKATLAITTSSFPDATVGKSYGPITLGGTAANGGTLSWSVSSGSLPAGLILSNGTISGTPTTAGESSFELTLTEAGGGTVKKAFTIKVSNAAPKINITSPLKEAVKGIPYTVPLQGAASGGGSLSWSLKDGSSLPTGLDLTSNNDGTATISGTPTADAGSYTFTVVLTEDGVADTVTKALTLSVREPKSYKATFTLNGGVGTVNDITVTEDGTANWNKFTLPAAPDRTGYVFNGWRRSYTNYDAGAEFTVADSMFNSTGSASLSFVAQWKDPDPVTATYTGQIVGSYELRGKLSDGDSYVYLGWGCADTPATSVSLDIPWSYLRSYDFASIGLWAYVDGSYQEIATYTNEPTASVTLTSMLSGLTVVTDVAAVGTNNAALTRNTDFTVSYLYWSSDSGSRYLYLPFMTTQTTGFTAYVRGVISSEYYAKYQWNKSYPAAISGSTATVTLDAMPTGVIVSGKVTYGTGDDAKALSGVQVQFSQYAYNQSLNFTATTGADGAYTVTGLIPNYSANWSVLSGGQRLESGTIYSGDLKTGESTTQNIVVNTAVAVLNVSLDLSDSTLSTYAQRSAVTNALWRGKIAFKQTNSSGASLGTDSLQLDDSSTHYIHNVAATDTVYYEITGSGVETTPGSFTLSNGVYSGGDTIKVKPNPGVVVTVTSPTYCKYALAWFNSGGSFVGASDALYFSSSGRTMFAAAPNGAAGAYTVALVPYTAVGAIDSANNNAVIHTWSVTLNENEIKALADFTVSRAASEDAAYATKPNSTLTAEKDSFATTGDLIRFTGSIGLDSGLTNGKLNYLKINVKNETDNISYSNTAPVQYVVLGGKLYSVSDFTMSSTGYYYKAGLSIDLPCEYTIYCKPGDEDWDMQLSMYANVSYSGGSGSDQLIGSATVKKPGASITTLSTYVCSNTIAVKGTAAANGTVDIYDGETLIGSATASKKGVWETRVTLANTDSAYTTTHVLTSRTATGARSDDLYVFHDPNGPELTSFRMAWSRNPSGIDVGDSYVYAGGMSNLTFKATFKNPAKLYETCYGGKNEKAKVVFKYWLTNGTIGTLTATESNGIFTATLPDTIYSSVARAEALYDPILNEKSANISDVVYTDGRSLSGVVMDEGTYAWSTGELASLGSVDAGTITKTFNHTTADSFTITFGADGKVVTTGADGLNALLIPKDSETITEQDKTDVATALNDYAAFQKDNFGMVPQSYSVEYNDVSTVQWLRDSASTWIAADKGTGNDAIPFAMYSRTLTLRTAAGYDAELTKLNALDTDYHYALNSTGGTVTGEEFIFTDATFGDYELVDGTGTFIAVVTAYKDTVNNVYEVDTELILMSNFTSYGSVIPSSLAYAQTPDGKLTARARLLLADPAPGSPADNQSSTSVSVADGASYAGYATTGVKSATKTLSKGKLVNTLFKTGNTAEKITTGLTKATSVLSKVGTGIDVLSLGLDTYNYVKYRSESPENAQKMHDQVEQIANSNEFKLVMEKLLNNPQGYTEMWCNQWRKDEDGNVVSRGGDSVTIPTVLDRLYTMMSSAQYWAGDDLQRSTAADVGMAIKAGSTGVGIGGAFIPGVGWVVSGAAGAVNIVGGGICDMMSGSLEQTRLEEYKRFMENWQYLVNYYESKYGFPKGDEQNSSGGGTGGSGGDDTGGASSSRAQEQVDNALTKKPPITNKVSNDPAGIVFEGVIENPVEGATVTLYYAAGESGNVVLQNENLDLISQLLQADNVDDLIPSDPVQITGADGRYSWGVPEGLWYVTAQVGGMSGNSNADTAATVSKSVGAATKFLPVLPVQLDVNIPLVDAAAPVVTGVQNTTDGIYVTFNKYMNETDVLNASNYSVYTIGTDTQAVTFTLESVDRGHTPTNLAGSGTTYSRTVLLKPTSALPEGTSLSLTVKSNVKSYANTPMGADYTDTSNVAEKIQLAKPSVKVSSTSTAVADNTVEVKRGDALILILPDGAPASAKIVYQIDGGTETAYASPIAVNGDFTLKVWCEAPGCTTSEVVTIVVKTPITGNGNNGGNNNGSNNGSNSGGAVSADKTSGGAVSADKTSAGEIDTVAKVSGNTAMASVSEKSTVDALKASKAGDTLTVKVDSGKASNVAISLPKNSVMTAANAKVDVRVETGVGTVTLSAGTVAALANAGEDAAINVTKNADGTTTVDVTSGSKSVDANVKVAIPAAQSGQTLVVISADGSSTPIRKSVVEDGVAYAQFPAGATVKVVDNTKSFRDVVGNEWYAGSVEFVTSHELFQGTDRGFEPNATMNRAMLATVLYRLEGAAAAGTNPFTDVADEAWYAPAVIWASDAGIVTGTGMGFEPDKPVSREQIATMLYRYANLLGMDTGSKASLDAFRDGGEVSLWASEAMRWAVSVSLFQGDDSGALNPAKNATRAEVATIIERMIKLIVK